MQLKVIDTEAARAGILAELNALQGQRTEVQDELKDLNATEMLLASLQERVDLLQDNHRQYSENLELSRIDEELRKEQISNVSVVQPPALILQPVSPNKKLVALAGCVLAMMNAVAVAMWRNRKAFTNVGNGQSVTMQSSDLHLNQNDISPRGEDRRISAAPPLPQPTPQAIGSVVGNETGARIPDEEDAEMESADESEAWSQKSKERSAAPR